MIFSVFYWANHHLRTPGLLITEAIGLFVVYIIQDTFQDIGNFFMSQSFALKKYIINAKILFLFTDRPRNSCHDKTSGYSRTTRGCRMGQQLYPILQFSGKQLQILCSGIRGEQFILFLEFLYSVNFFPFISAFAQSFCSLNW